MSNRAVLALGSNIEKEHNLPKAITMLEEMCQVTAVSPIYETEPVGLLNQPNFWNAAILIESELSAAEIKQKIIGVIEAKLRRVRQADKNAPRTIDADIVLFNDGVFEYDGGDGRSRFIPDPDLLIRTSGENRLSNFLLWQVAYSELYPTPMPWPDFDEPALHEAIVNYQSRERRYGMTGEQARQAVASGKNL